MEKIAIVGSGIAGLGCAWLLKDHAHITLLEKNSRPGGHTNTILVEEDGLLIPIDTGFIVFNKVTYPNLCALFDELCVTLKPAEMSFSVRHDPSGLEYNGMSLNKLFAQRRNIFSPKFWCLISRITKFFQVAKAAVHDPPRQTILEFVNQHRLGEDFLNLYLVPMSSAVWSTDSQKILDFPAETLIRFFYNHGFLGVKTHHQWFTLDGGAKTYLDKILADPRIHLRLSSPVTAIKSTPSKAFVQFANNTEEIFDRVILACHADQACLLIRKSDPEAYRLLTSFSYQKNPATLHTWEGIMPKSRLAWASWNYHVAHRQNIPANAANAKTHYWMNALQGVSRKKNYFVSLNSHNEIPPSHILYETTYEHPVFTRQAINAQAQLPSLNTRSPSQRIYYCGSYFKYGFHEDAYGSAVSLAQHIKKHLNS